MTCPTVTALPRRLEPVYKDTFIDGPDTTSPPHLGAPPPSRLRLRRPRWPRVALAAAALAGLALVISGCGGGDADRGGSTSPPAVVDEGSGASTDPIPADGTGSGAPDTSAPAAGDEATGTEQPDAPDPAATPDTESDIDRKLDQIQHDNFERDLNSTNQWGAP